jgi:hypothetical protein
MLFSVKHQKAQPYLDKFRDILFNQISDKSGVSTEENTYLYIRLVYAETLEIPG